MAEDVGVPGVPNTGPGSKPMHPFPYPDFQPDPDLRRPPPLTGSTGDGVLRSEGPEDNPLNEDDGKAILQEVFRVITWREFGTASEIKIEDLDSIERKFKNNSDRFEQIIRILLENQRTLDELCMVLCKNGKAKLAENITIAVTASRGLIRSSGAGGGAVRPVVPVQPQDNPLNGEDYEALHQYLFRGTADITWRDFGRATEIENLDSIEGNFLNDSGRFRKILSILSETPRTLDELCEVLRNNERTELAEKLRNWLISTRSLHRCSDPTCAA